MNGKPVSLEHDCSRCAALCCMALALDRGEAFAIDKPAGWPCPNLGPAGRCGIHDRLAKSGFSGCARYGCLGAGQRVTQELFGGRSWQDDPRLMEPMMDAFRTMRVIHHLLELMLAAADLPLTPWQVTEHDRLMARLDPAGGWSRARLAALDLDALRSDADSFFSSLQSLVARA